MCEVESSKRERDAGNKYLPLSGKWENRLTLLAETIRRIANASVLTSIGKKSDTLTSVIVLIFEPPSTFAQTTFDNEL